MPECTIVNVRFLPSRSLQASEGERDIYRYLQSWGADATTGIEWHPRRLSTRVTTVAQVTHSIVLGAPDFVGLKYNFLSVCI